MDKNIYDLRVSFLFTRTVLSEQLKYDTKEEFSCLMEQALLNRKNNNKNKEVALPWENSLERNHFWYYYLDPNKEDNRVLENLMEKAVPLFYNSKRKGFSLFCNLNSNEKDEKEKGEYKSRIIKCIIQPYIYRHGIGLIISIDINHNLNYEDLVKKVETLSDEKVYSKIKNENRSKVKERDYKWEEEKLCLKKLSNELLNKIQKNFFKKDTSKETYVDPFTIVTISTSSSKIDKSEKYSKKIKALKGEIPLKKSRDESDGQIKMYYSNRMRVIWYSEGEEQGKNNKMKATANIKYYRKNIEILSLQVESLSGFLKKYRSNLNQSMDDLIHHARKSQHVLCMLYGFEGQDNDLTYMSKSSIAQINDNYFHTINNIRDELSLVKLKEKNSLILRINYKTMLLNYYNLKISRCKRFLSSLDYKKGFVFSYNFVNFRYRFSI